MAEKRAESQPVLEIRNLKVNFSTYKGIVKALNGVDLKLYSREVLALVGESGCGKSVTAQTLIGLLPENASILEGEMILNGKNLTKKSKEEMRMLRAQAIAIVFQDPMTFLNPVLTIETQLEEVFMLQKNLLREAVAIQKAEGDVKFADLIKAKSAGSSQTDKGASKKKLKRLPRNYQ